LSPVGMFKIVTLNNFDTGCIAKAGAHGAKIELHDRKD
jgi:hypothetical protein